MARPVNVNGLVNDILYKYDHNKNGVVNLKRPDGFYTQRDLFYAADKDGNGEVTRDEMAEVVKKFDKDGDGQMTSRGFWGWLTRKPKQELDLYNDQYKERMTNYGSVDVPLK